MRTAATAGLALALALATPSAAQPVGDLQAADARVQSIGWRLSHANARQCVRGAPGIGLLLGDVQTFNDPAAARAAYSLTGDIAVAAVAADSPAAAAGLAANMTVTAVAGEAIGPPPPHSSWDRVWALQTRLEQRAAQTGEVALTLADGRIVTVRAAPSCAVRFFVDDDNDDAGATRAQVRIGRKMLARLSESDALVAALLAHELAHAVLDHETQLGPGQRPVAAVRRTEREADRLSVWILANAGYDPAAAAQMVRRISPHSLFVVAAPTHGKGSTRAQLIAAEIAVMNAAPDRDWATRFRPEP